MSIMQILGIVSVVISCLSILHTALKMADTPENSVKWEAKPYLD